MKRQTRQFAPYNLVTDAERSKSEAALVTPPVDRTKEQRNAIVVANKALCWKFASPWVGTCGFGIEDLSAAGFPGLIRAAELYDCEKLVRGKKSTFSTYASYWIRQSIRRWMENCARMIRLPSYKCSNNDNIESLRRQTEVLLFLDFDDGETWEPGQTPPDGPHFDEREALRDVLSVLDDREFQIISHRFGLSGEELSLDEIGKIVGCSKQRVSQIADVAIGKLYARLRARKRVKCDNSA